MKIIVHTKTRLNHVTDAEKQVMEYVDVPPGEYAVREVLNPFGGTGQRWLILENYDGVVGMAKGALARKPGITVVDTEELPAQ
ncbi:MAG: hypothetical protein Q8Q20_05090 [bacterium]|nr:hypothetical protein [bacterium]